MGAANAARAVASGADIFFADGQYRPGTRAGDWLIAHEVAHVARPGRAAAPPRVPGGGEHRAHAMESAADQAANLVIQGTGTEA